MTTRKMGRPPSENPRQRRLSLRITDDEYERIEICSNKLGKTKTEVVLYGIQLVEDSIQKGNQQSR